MPLLLIIILLGVVPAVIAYGKGRNFALWWIYGALLAPIALVHALMLRKNDQASEEEAGPAYRLRDPDSPVPLMLKCAAVVVLALAGYIGYRAMASSWTGTEDGTNVVVSLKSPESREAHQDTPLQPKPTETDPAASADTGKTAAGARDVASVPPAKPAHPEADVSAGSSRVAVRNADRTAPPTIEGKADGDRQAAADPKSEPVTSSAHERPESAADGPERGGDAAPQGSEVTAVGEIVRMVQVALAKHGYDPGATNGRADSRTRKAIRKFQADEGLKETGGIDYPVLKALNLVGPRIYAFKRPPEIPPDR